MSDVSYVPSFFYPDDKGGQGLTYPQLEARRRIALALATRNRPYPKTIGEGLTALGEGLGEGFANERLARDEAAQTAADTVAEQRMFGTKVTPGAPATSAGPRADTGVPADVVAKAYTTETAPTDTGSLSPRDQALLAQPYSNMPIDEVKQRIARNESGGRKDAYTLVGERSRRGDYPYGKYQVMGENIPIWSKRFIGRELTPEQFLADPDAQEQIATGKLNEYVAKYGPTQAAAAWFAGEKGMNDERRKDTLGTHVAEYKRRFNMPLVSRDEVAASAAGVPLPTPRPPQAAATDPENAAPFQVASMGDGVQVPETAQASPREMVAQAMTGPAPQPQQTAQAAPDIGQAPAAVPPTQQPLVTPQAIPPKPAQEYTPPEPGKEPTLEDYYKQRPDIQRQMEIAKHYATSRNVSPIINQRAEAEYNRLEKQANDIVTRNWTVWHEQTKAREAFRAGKEKSDIEVAKLRGEAEDAAENRIITHRLGGQSKDAFFTGMDKDKVAADLASRVMDDNRIILKAFKEGAIMGSGAGWRINAAKLASFALNNGYASDVAANNEIMRALGGSRIREQLANVNPVGVASNTDLLLSRQMSGTEPTMEPKAFLALLHRSSSENAKLLNNFEDKRDYYLSGTRAERNYMTTSQSTGPKAAVDDLLQHRDDKAVRARYDDTYGEGSSALEIERFKRRQRRGG